MYEVQWKPSARDQLADLWLRASDRNAITSAVNDIDRRLASNPQSLGESRSGGQRILFVPPLVAVFKVDPPDRRVTVLSVRRYPQRNPGP